MCTEEVGKKSLSPPFSPFYSVYLGGCGCVRMFTESLFHFSSFITYGQAISYALRLQTKGFGLVSLEGVKIWLADEHGHFNFEKGIRYSWEELETPEKLGRVRLLFKGYCRSRR